MRLPRPRLPRRRRRRPTNIEREAGLAAERRARGPIDPLRILLGALVGILELTWTLIVETFAIALEMIAIPVKIWFALAEAAGAGVLALGHAISVPILLAWRTFLRLEEEAELAFTPARGTAAVCGFALVTLAVSQFVSLSDVGIAVSAYEGVKTVAPAPTVGSDSVGDAHYFALLPAALAGAYALLASLGGRWPLARLIGLVGAATVALALLVDSPAALDEGLAGIAYEGANAEFGAGFWVQLSSGVALLIAGPLLSRYLRLEQREREQIRARIRSDQPKRPAGATLAGGSPA